MPEGWDCGGFDLGPAPLGYWKGKAYGFYDGGGEVVSQFVSHRHRVADDHGGSGDGYLPEFMRQELRDDDGDHVDDDDGVHLVENAERAGRRARSMVVRLCQANGHDHLGTLTFPGSWAGRYDYECCKELVSRFFHRWLSQRLNHDYVVVAEQHEDGAWHFHFTFRGRGHAWLLMAAWTNFLEAEDQHPPTRFVRTNMKYLGSSRKVGLYAGKYVSKTFGVGGVPAGRHRYSQGSATRSPLMMTAEGLGVPTDLTAMYEFAMMMSEGRAVVTWVNSQWGTVGFTWGPAP